MRRRTRLWVSLLPLLACLLAVRTPASTLRSQSTSSNRNRVQRPARSGGVRLEGDHHHEEIPHILVPREQGHDGQADGAIGLIAASVHVSAPAMTACEVSPQPLRKKAAGVRLTPPGRGPPSLLS